MWVGPIGWPRQLFDWPSCCATEGAPFRGAQFRCGTATCTTPRLGSSVGRPTWATWLVAKQPTQGLVRQRVVRVVFARGQLLLRGLAQGPTTKSASVVMESLRSRCHKGVKVVDKRSIEGILRYKTAVQHLDQVRASLRLDYLV